MFVDSQGRAGVPRGRPRLPGEGFPNELLLLPLIRVFQFSERGRRAAMMNHTVPAVGPGTS